MSTKYVLLIELKSISDVLRNIAVSCKCLHLELFHFALEITDWEEGAAEKHGLHFFEMLITTISQ